MANFINAAYDEMLRQKDVEYRNQVGSGYVKPPGTVGDPAAGKEETDCITYVIKVLSKAYTQTGKTAAASAVRKLYEDGTHLARYLSDEQGWKAIYWNPDVRYPPKDKNGEYEQEHPHTYQQAVKTGLYYDLPVSGYVINYRPNGPKTVRDDTGLEWLRQVKFAYGLARGAYHCFLVSYGEVYEAHIGGIGDSLYGVTPLEKFAWASGAIFFPPGSVAIPSAIAAAGGQGNQG